MQNKEKLKKLIDIFAELFKIEGNEWLIDAVLEKIKSTSTINDVSKHSVIQDIHEHCIEKVIVKQANEFYKNFRIKDIKQELIKDFIKMEHERRRDDFENFSLCVYQQIENITNYIFEQSIQRIWDSEKDTIAIKYFDKQKKQPIQVTAKELIFGTAKEWFANIKFRALLYFYYFDKKIKAKAPLNNLTHTFNEIYQVRNLNHRGSSLYGYQKKTLDAIKGNESNYYFKFYGFLENFIITVNNNIKEQEQKQNDELKTD